MRATNSYIFISKENNTKKENVIVLKHTIPYIFLKYFNVDQDKSIIEEIKNHPKRFSKEFTNEYDKKIRGSFLYNTIDSRVMVEYKIIEVDSTYYLDITLDSNKLSIISCLEELNEIFISKEEFMHDYITIISYDYVSEYYCNRVYPILNKFERKFRKLLFNIFTAQFKDLYFEKTATEEIIIKVKEKLKKKKGENLDIYRKQNYFYSLDIGMIRNFLFDETWTSVEEEYKNTLLKQNFSEIDESKIKQMIENIRPRSNWNRFFADKGFSDDIESVMSTINELRNLVAHNKIFSRIDYNLLKDNLNKMIRNIDIALKKTESKDFILINKRKYYELIKHFKETMDSISNQVKTFK